MANNLLAAVLEDHRPLDRNTFQKTKEAEFTPDSTLTGLKLLRDRAGRERDLRELYRGRAPYELLQNADDAEAHRAAFFVLSDGLAFAHSGKWFTVKNFRSLADGWSDKDPKQCIGHKGLGFRAVLDITPSPYVIKVAPKDFFGVKFTWALNSNHIAQTIKSDPSLKRHYDSWTKTGQSACPVMYIPNLANKHNLGGCASLYDQLLTTFKASNFSTLFWFPSNDPDIDKKALNDLSPMPVVSRSKGRDTLRTFVEAEVAILLPFLRFIRHVEVYDGTTLACSVSIVSDDRDGGGPHNQNGVAREIAVETRLSGQLVRSEAFFQVSYDFPIGQDIKNRPDTPKAVKMLSQATVTLSARLHNGIPASDSNSHFHVYFPTDEKTCVGFTIHGSFYVKPDRTRLMVSDYNDWLLESAAKKAANDFLAKLLAKYPARHVFSALAPTGTPTTPAAERFISYFSLQLKANDSPFVPTSRGLVGHAKVALPPSVDEKGFWDSHFGSCVTAVLADKVAFLLPSEDGQGTRAFLKLAGISSLSPEDIVPFVECATGEVRTAKWWYDSYEYMATDEVLSRKAKEYFVGKRLLPVGGDTIAIPPHDGLTVCLPPSVGSGQHQVPRLFSDSFVFIDADVADLLAEDTEVTSWVRNRLHIVKFHAYEFLPRAVGTVAKALFGATTPLKMSELIQAWIFIKAMTEAARGIEAGDFWESVGRFSVPSDGTTADDELRADKLMPAFLAYWPDALIEGRCCLTDVANLRRASVAFFEQLVVASGESLAAWKPFFNRMGISRGPKVLHYKRLAVGESSIAFTKNAPKKARTVTFSGERQVDCNRAVVQILSEDGLWNAAVSNAELCPHPKPPSLQTMKVLDGFVQCVATAEAEYAAEKPEWQDRLSTLFESLPITVDQERADLVFCRWGSSSGHSIEIVPYISRQMCAYRWLPTTHGPRSSNTAFSRLRTRRLISLGRSAEEWGDRLLPYLVVDRPQDQLRLQEVGVETLEDAESASPSALVRALGCLGEQLASEWGETEVVGEPARWRLVRGAIQDVYQYLNKAQGDLTPLDGLRVAARENGTIVFRTAPLYYAEPGSPIESAFADSLPLIDVDNVYASLFTRLRVVRLDDESNCTERFLGSESAVPAPYIHDQIVSELSPYLLAPIIAKTDNPKVRERIWRRLSEFFEVKTTEHLCVSYTLTDSPGLSRTVEFPHFYLQRQVVSRQGAIEDAHFTLYVGGENKQSIFDLDGDALGEVLASVFFDNVGRELAGLFPRIASRFVLERGDRDVVEEFLYRQLRISKDALERARAIVSGEVDEPPPPPAPPPPPRFIPQSQTGSSQGGGNDGWEDMLQEKASELADKLAGGVGGQNGLGGDGEHRKKRTIRAIPRVTADQERRGVLGEEEIKRRLGCPEGWQIKTSAGWGTLTLQKDLRDTDCGFDFLCLLDGREVELEVKTFTANGYIHVTGNELMEAAIAGERYYILGVLYDNRPPREWETYLIQNPIDALREHGAFSLEPSVSVSPRELFNAHCEDE